MVDRVAIRRGVPAGLSGPAGPAAGHLQPLLRQHPAPGSGGQGAPRHPVLDGRHRRRAQPAPECGADPHAGHPRRGHRLVGGLQRTDPVHAGALPPPQRRAVRQNPADPAQRLRPSGFPPAAPEVGMRTRTLIGLLLSTLGSFSHALEWTGIRDGAIHLWPEREGELHIAWSPAWQADANEERLYLQRGNGSLLQRFIIPAEEVRGQRGWRMQPVADGYRLEIPGYSFRHYQVRHPDTTASLFEPVKHHFSMEAGRGLKLYFRVPAGIPAQLGGKYHDGVTALRVERLSDGRALTLELKRHGLYPRHDLLALPTSPRDEIWRLRLAGSGKAAFWLDQTDNLFALRPEDLRHRPSQQAGTVNLRVGQRVVGPPARLGIGLPYTLPEDAELMRQLRPQTAGHYSFVNVMARNPAHEQRFRPAYRHRYGIAHDITLMAKTGRVHLLEVDSTSRAGLKVWLDSTLSLGSGGVHYLSPADEPNLNYPDYASFSRYFGEMARLVREDPRARDAGIRIAMPASSRLVNGPTMRGARERRGLDWAARLLEEHEPLIDALAWHEWFIRDLRATDWYRYSVRRAADLVGYTPEGRPRKALRSEEHTSEL